MIERGRWSFALAALLLSTGAMLEVTSAAGRSDVVRPSRRLEATGEIRNSQTQLTAHNWVRGNGGLGGGDQRAAGALSRHTDKGRGGGNDSATGSRTSGGGGGDGGSGGPSAFGAHSAHGVSLQRNLTSPSVAVGKTSRAGEGGNGPQGGEQGRGNGNENGNGHGNGHGNGDENGQGNGNRQDQNGGGNGNSNEGNHGRCGGECTGAGGRRPSGEVSAFTFPGTGEGVSPSPPPPSLTPPASTPSTQSSPSPVTQTRTVVPSSPPPIPTFVATPTPATSAPRSPGPRGQTGLVAGGATPASTLALGPAVLLGPGAPPGTAATLGPAGLLAPAAPTGALSPGQVASLLGAIGTPAAALSKAGLHAPARSAATHRAATRPAAAGPNVIQRFEQVVPSGVWLALAVSLVLAAVGGAAALLAGRRVRRQAGQFAAVSAAALTDPLTGVLNRRGFIEAAERELARARRYQRSVVLAFVDVRGLKGVNDSEGHLAGDKLLRQVAGMLKESARADDVVGRIGGDELGLLLAEQSAESAQAITSRIKDQVPARRAAIGLRAPWDLTIGTAGFPEDGESVDELLSVADRRLYQQRGIALR